MIFDTVVIFALLFSCVIAFLRGFIREVLTIFGLVAGAAAAYYLGPQMVPAMTHALGERAAPDYKLFGEIHGNVLAQLLAYAAVFFPVVIALSVLSYFLYTGARAIGLGPLDRTLGVVFGIVRAMLLLGLLWLPFYTFTDKADRDKWPILQDSHTRVYVEAVAGWMVSIVPGDMLAGIKKDADRAAKDAKTAKQTLQDIDVLHKDKDKDSDKTDNDSNANPPATGGNKDTNDVQPVPQPASAAPPSSGPGYQDQQRQDMGHLIDKGMNQ
jgi:membrane protein required for colicin V production